jgi:hypothetical protein
VLWWRAADRRVRALNGARLWRGLLGVFIGVQLGFMMMMVVGSITEHVPQWGPMLWPVGAYVWHLFLLPAAVMGLLLARGAAWVKRKRAAKAIEPALVDEKPKAGLTRREALSAVGAALPPLITMAVGVTAVERLGEFQVREVDLKLPGLPVDLDGVTIAHVSDLHIGRFLPAGVMERMRPMRCGRTWWCSPAICWTCLVRRCRPGLILFGVWSGAMGW